jgi:hypothetical protein
MRDYADRYGPGTIILHWLIAVLILGLIGLGFLMTRRAQIPRFSSLFISGTSPSGCSFFSSPLYGLCIGSSGRG